MIFLGENENFFNKKNDIFSRKEERILLEKR